jgi:hypothetical protein
MLLPVVGSKKSLEDLGFQDHFSSGGRRVRL